MKIINKIGYELNQREQYALRTMIEERELDDGGRSPQGTKKQSAVVVSNDERYWIEHDELVISLKEIHDRAREIDFGNDADELRALFYPAASIDDAALKHALLYFDKICVITPDESGGHSLLRRRDAFKPAIPKLKHLGAGVGTFGGQRDDGGQLLQRIHQFNESTWGLRRDGYMYFLSPSRSVTPQFYRAVQADLDSDNFVSSVKASGVGPFHVGTSKAFGFHYRVMLHAKAARGDDQIIERGIFEEMIRCLMEGEEDKGLEILFSRFQESLFGPYGMVKVSPEVGAAILLNHTIVSCQTFGLTPFTDNQLYQELLLDKFQRAVKSDAVGKYRAELRQTSAILATQIMNVSLPKLELRSFDDVLEQKTRLRDELLRFRTEIMKFAAQVKATPYEDSYLREIERVIAANIAPAIEDLSAKIKGAKRAMVSNVLKSAKAGAVPIAATLFAGLPLPYVLALSAGIITLEALWEVERARRDAADLNGLSFLMRVS